MQRETLFADMGLLAAADCGPYEVSLKGTARWIWKPATAEDAAGAVQRRSRPCRLSLHC